MGIQESQLAHQLISLDAVLHTLDADTVAKVVGNRWTFEAGTLNLRPRKKIVRQIPLISTHFSSANPQALEFMNLYAKPHGSRRSQLIDAFQEPAMNLSVNASARFDGQIEFVQIPHDELLIPSITTGDVGRMMLVNDILLEFEGPQLGMIERDDSAAFLIEVHSDSTR